MDETSLDALPSLLGEAIAVAARAGDRDAVETLSALLARSIARRREVELAGTGVAILDVKRGRR